MIIKIMTLLKKLIFKVDVMYIASKILPLIKCMFLSLGIIFFLNGFYNLRSPIIFILAVSVMIHIVLLIIKENKSNMVMYFIIIIVISILLFGGLIFKISYREFLENTYHWCIKYNGENDLFRRDYSLFTTFILTLGITISIYFLHKIKLMKYIFSFLLPVSLILFTVYGISISKITITCVFLYVLPVLVGLMGKPYENEQKEYLASGTTIYLIPVYCIMIVIATVVPSSEKPINWNVIREIASDINEKGAYIRNKLEYFSDTKGKEFAFSTGGYEDKEENDLGGSIETNNNVSLLVTTNSKSKANGYLIGSIYDVYTGRGFKKSERKQEVKESEFYYDYVELINTLGRESVKGTNLKNIIGKRSYDITFKDIRTRTIFHPSRMIGINLPKNTKYEETTLGSMVLNKAKGMGYSYDLTYYELNLESEVLKEMFRNVEQIDELSSQEGINRVSKEYLHSEDITNEVDLYHLYEEAINRRERIYETYTKLPSTVTDRTRKLAYELTKDFHNDYDKLKAIEAFLNSYEYTTKVSKVKDNVDFVDYFLFEEKKGYCTYYAASMVVLARCVNIPIRYIEGYVVDYNEKGKDSTYKVLSSNAHAWVEGYLKGFGWIPFEPTAGFYQSRYSGWVDYTKVNDFSLDGKSNSYIDNKPSDYDQLVDTIKNNELEHSSRVKYIDKIIKVILLVFVIIILMIIFVLVYYYFLEKRFKKKYLSSDYGKKVIILVNELLRLFALDGYKRLDSETLLQFCNSRGNILKKDISLLDVVIVYMKVRYGEEIIDSEELDLVATFVQEYKVSLIPKVGKLKMFYFRFFYFISMND